jgi:hypothetical protein
MQHYVASSIRTLTATWLGLVLSPAVGAAEPQVPPDMQAHVLVRTLAFDRALPGRAGTALGLGVVFGSPEQDSMRFQYDLRRAFQRMSGTKVLGRTVTVHIHTYKGVADLTGWIQEKEIDALYIAPGLRSEVVAIRGVCRQHKIASLAAGRWLVEQGVAIGVVPNGEKLRIIVNLAAATSAGMDLDGKLLQLAEVLTGDAARQ